jgi:ubiquinone/menaquinone biosynthesis C-methylase UbiE
MYYQNKIERLKEIFKTENIVLKQDHILINSNKFNIKNDVIIINSNLNEVIKSDTINSFGSEWLEFNEITPEHHEEFKLYFDLIDIEKLKNKHLIDLGCGIGRWSKILIDKINIKSIVLLDLSESIFIAREFFREYDNVIFIKDDLENINFKENAFDFLICLGVLHHLPKRETNILEKIYRISNESLIYLYYKLDKTALYYRIFFYTADIFRKILSRSKSEKFNIFISYLITIFFYFPFIILVKILNLFKINTKNLPLSFYKNSSFFRVRQDAYDRFFTNIEFRTSKNEIMNIYGKFYKNINISKKKPYWHFYCKK